MRWFASGCLFEIGLSAVAIVVGQLLGRPAGATLRWDLVDVGWGVAGALPLLLVFYGLLETKIAWLEEISRFLEEAVRPIFGAWAVWQLALISALAGVGEELLFRGVLQGELTRLWGSAAGLVLASISFGLVHFVTSAYAVIATLIGVYLGLLWIWTGNLLTPAVTHGLYDFAALIYFLRWRRS